MEPKIQGSSRLIIVLGMARSGTTIFTHALASHPDIELYRSGQESWLLENDSLVSRSETEIQKLLITHRGKRYILLKRPWQERHYMWFHKHLKDARYFICLRDREAVIKSWNTTGHWAVRDHPGIRINPSSYFNQFRSYALIMRKTLGCDQCMLVRYEDVLQRKVATFERISSWLGISNLFALDAIMPGGRWDPSIAAKYYPDLADGTARHAQSGVNAPI